MNTELFPDRIHYPCAVESVERGGRTDRICPHLPEAQPISYLERSRQFHTRSYAINRIARRAPQATCHQLLHLYWHLHLCLMAFIWDIHQCLANGEAKRRDGLVIE